MSTNTKLAVILHADVAGSTRLVQADERLAHHGIQETFRRLSGAVASAGGRTHEIRGDALLAEFDRASDAVGAALDFQAINARHLASPESPGVALRIGISLGEVIIADGTVTGAGVVLAQRIEQLAEPGGVCVSAAVREAIPERLAVDLTDSGEHRLKGFDRHQRVFGATPASEEARHEPKETIAPAPDGEVDSGRKRPSIVVLPFVNRGSEPDAEFLADGLTEDITTTLSCQRWLLVISRPSAAEVASRLSGLREVGRELDVRYVLTGTVRQAGERVRVTSTLTEAETSQQVWSNRYDRVLEDIFDMQDEIARSIVAELVPELTAKDLQNISGLAPQNLSAWEAYQRGIAELQHQSVESFERAKALFRTAIEHDPEFASAHAYYGYMLFRQLLWMLVPRETVKELFAVADRATNLDPRDGNAHVVLGLAHLMRCDPGKAIEEIDLALKLNPSSAFAYVMRASVSTFCAVSHESALADLASAARLSPTDRFDRGQRLATAAYANLCLGRDEEAARAGEDAWRAGGMFGGIAGAGALAALGRLERARELVGEILGRHPEMSIAFCRKAFFYMPPNEGVERYCELAMLAGVPAGDGG